MTERQNRYVGNLFEGFEKDEFKGREYTVAYPEEGDIVRINLHTQQEVFITSPWGKPEKLRDHFVLMWPSSDRIRKSGYIRQDRKQPYVVSCYGIDLGGSFGWSGLCYVPESDIVVKPTMIDLFEFGEGLRMAGKIYDRKRKIIMNKKEYLYEIVNGKK